MGHYRSEMGFEAEDERCFKEQETARERRAAKIKADIAKRGIERVLADIVSDPTGYSIWSHG